MKGIYPKGTCPKCGKGFKFNAAKLTFRCSKHLIEAKRFIISVNFKGERIRRATTLEGKTLETFAQAHALLKQAQGEMEAKRFDPEKWKSKKKIDYRFNVLIWTWYGEKEALMDQGKRAPGYVPKLKTYIAYYEAFYHDTDVREVFNCKDFVNNLPSRLSPKYQKNIMDGLKGFFKWLREDRYIQEVPRFPVLDIPEHEPVTISKETQYGILECIPEEHKPLFTWLFYQGCRPGETRALKWDCIAGDVVTYKRTFSADTLVEHTKTKNIRHNLIFSETLVALPQKGLPDAFVFTHGKNVKRHYSEAYATRIYNKALAAFNEQHGTDLHVELYEATKHSFGTQMVNESEIPLDMLQEWFGHTKADMTKKYAKLKIVDAFRKRQNVIPLRKENKGDKE